MPGGGEIGCWEGVFHGGMVAGEGDYSQREDVREAEDMGRGSGRFENRRQNLAKRSVVHFHGKDT